MPSRSPLRGTRLVVGAFTAFVLGAAVFALWPGSTPVVPPWQSLALVAASGVIPVVLLGLCGVRLVRGMDRRNVPLIAQALVTGVLSTILCTVIAAVGAAIAGSSGGITYFVAPVAAWCGFFAVPIGRLLEGFARLYVGVAVVEIAIVVVGTVLLVL